MFSKRFSTLMSGLVIGLTVLSCAPAWADLFGGGNAPRRGLVVGDEPAAVRAAAKVLGQGGSAADAATALYFSLAVTFPVAAGLGGGGICVVRDAPTGRAAVFDFLARAPAGGGPYAVPGNVRGFALLQNRFGRIAWARTIVPAEGLAAAGFSISRALHTRLTKSAGLVRGDGALRSQFLDESGAPRATGTMIASRNLSATLAIIRTGGADAFYRGEVARQIAAYSAGQGGEVTLAELGAYRAGEGEPHVLRIGPDSVYLAPMRLGAGKFAAGLISLLVDTDGTLRSDAGATGKALAQSMKEFGVESLPEDMGSTSFAVSDTRGQAVACAVTMNGGFGAGHTVEGTGVLLAHSPSADKTGLSGAFLTPLLAEDGGGLVLAGAGAGGPNGTAAIANALLRMARGERLSQPGDLRSTGAAPYETVNLIACQSGGCAAFADPDADGIAASEGQ